jgi:hypothetical protein
VEYRRGTVHVRSYNRAREATVSLRGETRRLRHGRAIRMRAVDEAPRRTL